MAVVRVRYRTGDEESWELHDQMDLSELSRHLFQGMAGPKIGGFGIASKVASASTDYGMVCLRLSEVVMVEVDGMVDEAAAAALWAEGEPLDGPPDEPSA
jgi:hypothetical protein